MYSIFLFLSAICGFTGVAIGAFGAHGLKTIISPEMLSVYRTGVDYQMWHALGLGLIALFRQQAAESVLLKFAGWLMFFGIVLFSGSLYILAVLNIKWVGMITPIGGVFFISSWILVTLFAINYKK